MAPERGQHSVEIRIGLVGGGRGGAALLNLLLDWPEARVAVVIDPRPEAPAMGKATSLGIPTAARHLDVFAYPVNLVLEATGNPTVLDDLLRAKPVGVEVIGAGSLRFFWDLLQNLLQPTQGLQAQVQMAVALGSTLDLEQQAVIATRTLARACGVDRCSLFFFDDETARVRPVMAQFASGRPVQPLWAAFKRLGELTLAEVPCFRELIAHRAAIEIVNPDRDPRVPRAWTQLFQLKSLLIVPLVRKGRVVGACALDYYRAPRRFTQDQLALAASLGSHVSLAFENARLFQQAEHRAEKLTALSRLTRLMTSAAQSAEVCHAVAEAAATLLGATTVRVWVADDDARVLREAGSFGIDPAVEAMMTDFPVIPYGQGLVGRIVESREPEYLLDFAADPRWLNRRLATEGGLQSFAGVPLTTSDRTVGVLALLFKDRRDFTREEKELMGLLADQAAIAIANARLLDEAERRRREAEALAELAHGFNERLQALIQASPLPICVLDREGAVTLWNPAAEQVFGWRADEILGRTLPTVPEDKREEFMALLTRVLAGEALTGVELRRERKDGSPVDILLSTAPLRDAGRNVTGMIGIITDVTERRRLEAHVREAQKMDAIGQLAAGIAHDFNNLLTVIVGQSQVLLRQPAEDNAGRPAVELIAEAAERATALTRQLLAFGRKQVLQPRPLDLNAVVARLTAILRRLLREDIELITNVEPGLGLVSADEVHLEQVIVNLVVNARDAMPRGGHLTLATANVALDDALVRHPAGASAGRHVMLSVTDTGIGMAPETQARIFEPFFTTRASGGGTGLGLATVYGIVKQHGGHITVSSAPGRGSTFTIYLPEVGQAALAAPEGPASGEGRRSAATVLVVEDVAAVRDVARDMLEGIGYTVLPAGSGQEALRIAAAHAGAIGLLLTDVAMPDMNGREVAKRVTALQPRIKVLYMSGYPADVITRQGALDPDVALLEKPFTSGALARKVREALDNP